VSVARADGPVEVPAVTAAALWTNTDRWATFVEGFAHVNEKRDGWPEPGGKIVWRSIPGGRGIVSERVLEHTRDDDGSTRIVTRVFEEALTGKQTATFTQTDAGCEMALELEYQLAPNTVMRTGVLGKVTNALFIRRALSDSLARTIRRFTTEAHEEASL
jgi:hypothetical protein